MKGIIEWPRKGPWPGERVDREHLRFRMIQNVRWSISYLPAIINQYRYVFRRSIKLDIHVGANEASDYELLLLESIAG